MQSYRLIIEQGKNLQQRPQDNSILIIFIAILIDPLLI